MAKVTFTNDGCGTEVRLDGDVIAYISGSRGEYYLVAASGTEKFIARFKHGNPMASAKHFARTVLAQVAVEDAVARSAKDAPLTWAKRDLGYISYNVQKLTERRLA